MILQDGYLSITPPKRVWEEYSEDYVYLIPFETSNEEEREEAFRFAAEQSSFALYELDGTKRVVLEIQGLEEELLEEDPDARSIGALRYPKNIPVSLIKNIYTEENGNKDLILELIALTKFLRLKDEKKLGYIDTDCLYFEEEEEERKKLFETIGVAHLELIEPSILADENEQENRYMHLLEEVEGCPTFVSSLLQIA